MVRIVATIKKFIQRCKLHRRDRKPFKLLVDDIDDAERTIVRLVQQKYLQREIQFYSHSNPSSRKQLTNKERRKEKSLWKLDPYLDPNGILRVGGRIRKSSFSDELKNPVILPKDSVISRRIADHIHHEVKHRGRTTTLKG